MGIPRCTAGTPGPGLGDLQHDTVPWPIYRRAAWRGDGEVVRGTGRLLGLHQHDHRLGHHLVWIKRDWSAASPGGLVDSPPGPFS